MKNITETMQCLRTANEIRSSLEQGVPVVVLGSPGSGKTEQVVIATRGVRRRTFDLRQRFLDHYFAANGVIDPAARKAAKRRYNTTRDLKQLEWSWLGSIVGEAERELTECKEQVIVFDELDLASGERLEGDELSSALLVMDLAARVRDAGKNVVLIIHSKGQRTPGFIEALVEKGLLRSVDGVVKIRFFDSKNEETLLRFIGLEDGSFDEILGDFRGLPAAYLGVIECLADAADAADGAATETCRKSAADLVRDAEWSVEKVWDVARSTSPHEVVELLVRLACGTAELRSPAVVGERDRLIDTGLLGVVDGALVMPPIVRRVVLRRE
jgi:hypothetical protein